MSFPYFPLQSFRPVLLLVLSMIVVRHLTAAEAASGTGDKALFTADRLLQHIRVLASDEFEGRAPASVGEERTVAYLMEQFRKAGAVAGNPDGTFLQRVPLVGSTAQDVQVSYHAQGQTAELKFPQEAVVWTKRLVPEMKVENSEMIFVGYGVVAPEYGWDDYKGVDVRGKTIVMLINDPPLPDPADSKRLDEGQFKGRAMTYYGRWTYKFEIAAEKGATAALIVHETEPAGYPWAVVEGSNSQENFDLQSRDRNMNRAAVEGWMTLEKARQLCAAAGQDFDALKRSALSRDFRPVRLAATINYRFANTFREVASQNVIAKIEGSDPRLRSEYLVYTAHWDHLGRNPRLEGDQIFNGAVDNASGVACLLELARGFHQARPKRTVLFLSVTAEEKGLLGAKHYAREPLYPLDRTVAEINMDSMNPLGRTRDVSVIGYGQTSLEETVKELAEGSGRVIVPDPEPEKGRYFRSDHFEFAKVGVPALYLHAGLQFVGQPAGFGLKKVQEYVARDYHKVSDEIKPDWDLSGMVEDTRLLFEVGQRVANGDRHPEWKAGSEFRKLRPPASGQSAAPK